MNSLTIAYYTMLRNFRDFKAMIPLTLLPIILTTLLGFALDSEYAPKQAQQVRLGIAAENAAELEAAFKAFLGQEEMAEWIAPPRSLNSVDEGIAQLQSGELDAFLRISQTDGMQLYDEKEVPIATLAAQGFAQQMNLQATLVDLHNQSGTQPAQSASSSASIVNSPLITEGHIPRGIDYYAVTQIFGALFGAILGIFTITKDGSNQTDLRISRTMARPYEIVLGKMIGCAIPLFATSIIVYMYSKFVLQANWDANLLVVIAVLLMFAFISVNLGMLLATVTRNTIVSVMMIFVLYMIFTLASGGFSLQAVTPILERIAQFTPNQHAQQALFGSIYGGYHPPVSESLSILGMMTAALVLAQFALLRRASR